MSLEIFRQVASGRAGLALCTVLEVKGSGPRHTGSRMLAGPDGLIEGSVGGGRGEATVLAACREALVTRTPAVLRVEMQGTEAEGPEMVCGGHSRILVEPSPAAAPYRVALERVAKGERVLLVTGVRTGRSAVMGERGEWLFGDVDTLDRADANRALDTGRPALLETEGLFLDPVLPPEKLLILGGGHVGRALASIAPALGFVVTVGDDRPEFLAPDRFPAGVSTRLGAFTEIVEAFPFDLSTYAVVVTRGHLCDLESVRALLGKPYRYAGLMGSRRKTRLVLEQLLADGSDPAKVEALHAPIGLEIGAETPEELAIAMAGELVAVRRGAPALARWAEERRTRRRGP